MCIRELEELDRCARDLLYEEADVSLDVLVARRCRLSELSRRVLSSGVAVSDVTDRIFLARAATALESVSPADEALRDALTDATADGVERLPGSAEKALLMAYLYGLTYRENCRREAAALAAFHPDSPCAVEAAWLLEGLEHTV